MKAASTGPLWYQLYLIGGRHAAEGAIERARRAGYSALVLTLDTPLAGERERDPRNGMKELLAPALLPKARFFLTSSRIPVGLLPSCLMAECQN